MEIKIKCYNGNQRVQEGGKEYKWENKCVWKFDTFAKHIFRDVDILDMHVHYISLPRAALFDFVRGSKNYKLALTWHRKAQLNFFLRVYAYYFRLQKEQQVQIRNDRLTPWTSRIVSSNVWHLLHASKRCVYNVHKHKQQHFNGKIFMKQNAMHIHTKVFNKASRSWAYS